MFTSLQLPVYDRRFTEEEDNDGFNMVSAEAATIIMHQIVCRLLIHSTQVP